MRNVERAKAGVCVFSLRVPQTYVDVVVFGGGADGAHLGTVGGEGVLGIFCCGGGGCRGGGSCIVYFRQRLSPLLTYSCSIK